MITTLTGGGPAAPDPLDYDRIAVAFSGKDSLACLLHLLERGVPASRIELHHHDVDGGGDLFMDWACSRAYCAAVARAFGLPLYVSCRVGGFLREMSRLDQPTAPIRWEGPDGTFGFAGGVSGRLGTRGYFPQVSADLAVRWCSPVTKIDVFDAVIRAQPRFHEGKTLVVTGERAEESPGRARYAARLGLWGGPDAPFHDRAAFLDAMEKGGVATMELAARELKAMGLYIARSLSFEGVEYEPLRHELTAENIEVWDAWADAFQLIHANLRQALEAIGVSEEGKAKSPLAASAAMSAFEGAKLRFFAHLLAGMKAPTLVASVRLDLAEGRSAVVQIVSTNEAVMERRLADIPPEEWSNLTVDLSPKDYVLDYLTGAFPIIAMTEVKDEDGKVTMVPLMEDGAPVVSQAALALREQLITDMACLPAVSSVLDAILDALGTDHVAEITGRSRRVVLREGRRVVERRSASAAKAETDAFMAGKKRVLVFSDAGGTGRSYHADLGVQNQQRRVHYLVEPGWRADAAIQGLGRSHRTNQACAPLFRPVTTDIQGEKRFLSTIARRLDSLGALTRGERRTAGNGLFRAEDNLESPWARKALLVFYSNLLWGEVGCMDLETFQARTGLSLMDADGGLKKSDDLPPMNTFLNRVLALRIADQNAIFQDFEKILDGILERAAAAGALEKGVEDIVADEVTITGEEVIRTDTLTGAETKIVTFQVKTVRELTGPDQALHGLDPACVEYAVNGKSGRAGLIVKGLTTTNDDDRLVPAVRIIRPESRKVVPLKLYEESAWDPVDETAWRSAWEAEVAAADPWNTRTLALATGLLLPIWTKLPAKQSQVRRLKAPDGRRWLGRVLDPAQVPQLKIALGLSDAASAVGDAASAMQLVLQGDAALSLASGLWARRARVMDRWRVEIVGAAQQRSAFTALGCFVEIISYTPRVFVPTDKPEVLEAVLKRWPVESLLPGKAAA